jgi:asparagine synthase (glutamine-hydrolysing)
VPIGAFLSGGIDSTIVCGLMAREGPARTYSIGFEEEKFSELPHAREAARAFGTDHHEFVVRADSAAVLPLLVERYGEPFGDSSAIPTWFVARETARHVKVALSGDGGDECFAGYLRHEAIARLSRLKRIPAAALKAAAWLFPETTLRGERIRRLLRTTAMPLPDLYLDLVTTFTPEMKAELGVDGEVRDRIAEPFSRVRGDPVTAAGYTDLLTYLPDDILVKVDIASMANGLEVRCPFLDPEVVDLAFRIPGPRKRGKAALKRAFRELLPAKIRRRGKMGFAVPLAEWLRGPLRSLMEDALLGREARERGVFAPGPVERWVREHLSGKRDHRDRLWLLLMFELWARKFLGR